MPADAAGRAGRLRARSELKPPAGHRTLAQKAFDGLHQAIITGQLQPGERLPIEELAEALEMSPMPIREALRRLDTAGLVEHVPHRGARVTELSVEDLREIYDVRLILEPMAMRRAAERFDDDDAARAREALERHVAAYRRGDLLATFAAHTDFHFSFYRAARSRWLLRLITPAWESSERYRLTIPGAQDGDLEDRRAEHERILQACVDRDPDAAACELYDHLTLTANRLSERMGAGPLFRSSPAEGAIAP